MSLEILHLGTEGEWWLAQVAVDDQLAVPFSFHKTVREQMGTDLAFMDYLERQGKALLQAYGDARQWPEHGFQEVEKGANA